MVLYETLQVLYVVLCFFSAAIQSSCVVYAFVSIKARAPERAIGSMRPRRHVVTMTIPHFSLSPVVAIAHSFRTSYVGFILSYWCPSVASLCTNSLN